MMTLSLQEEAKLDAMQRVWQNRRGMTPFLFEEVPETENLLAIAPQSPEQDKKQNPFNASSSASSLTFACSGVVNENEFWDLHDHIESKATPALKQDTVEPTPYITLNASELGDFPAKYTICCLKNHQFPVVGVYADNRVITGFKYRVRPLPPIGELSTRNKCLFDNRALTLISIGRGFSKRFTFEADQEKLNSNENYFWSDNRPEGYAFELEVVSEGDKFTVFDLDGEAQGTLEILTNTTPQIEISNSFTNLGIEKRADVKFTGKVEFFETGVAKPMPFSGTVVCLKGKSKSRAEVIKIINVMINKHRYVLKPGIQKVHRRVTVRGVDINDVPTKYSMNGLEPYEIPVVGTYVDSRVIPGFYYKVRPNDRKDRLFGGRALKLVSIGMGYAKRLTFEPDNMLEQNNYLWSDNHPDGLGLEPKAIHKGMKFFITNNDQVLGEATVFRADMPQIEEKMEKIMTPSGKYAIQKYILVEVTCHIRLTTLGRGSTADDEHLMRVCGLAVVRKEPNSNSSYVVRVENVGLNSQLYLLFAQTHTELTLIPKH